MDDGEESLRFNLKGSCVRIKPSSVGRKCGTCSRGCVHKVASELADTHSPANLDFLYVNEIACPACVYPSYYECCMKYTVPQAPRSISSIHTSVQHVTSMYYMYQGVVPSCLRTSHQLAISSCELVGMYTW